MGTQAAEKTERLLNLVICLLHTRRPLLKQQIRRAVPQYDQESDEAFDRMFERDKDELRALGIPLLSAAADPLFDDEFGYRIDRREYALPQIEFTPGEIAALTVAARTWMHASLAGSGAEALRKLVAGAGGDGLVESAGDLPATLQVAQPRVRTVEPAFDAVHRAVLQSYPIAFRYRRPGGEPSTRTVQPWGIASWHGRWYLTGYDLDRADARVFRLGRIEGSVTRAGKPGSYQVPEGHDARATIRSVVRRPEGEARSARLRVRAGRAHELRRRAIPPPLQADARREAGVGEPAAAQRSGDSARSWDEIDVRYQDTDRFAAEICGYGPDVLVLEPPELRAEVQSALQAVIAAHTPPLPRQELS